MALTRVTAATGATLVTRIQQECGDPNGTRYTAAEYLNALNDACVEMANVMALALASEPLLSASLTYTGPDPNALPSGVNYEAIVRVDDASDTTRSVPLRPLSAYEFESYDPARVYSTSASGTGWTLMSDTTAGSMRIWLLPRVTGTKTLTIYYFGSPWTFGSTNDSSPIAPRFHELLVLKTALKLLRRDDEQTRPQEEQHAMLHQQFMSLSTRLRTPPRIRSARSLP